MADKFQAELAFAKTYLNTLGRQPVVYADDYQQAPENSLKKVPVLPIPVPPVPQPKASGSGSNADSAIVTVTFKSLKPALAYSHPISLTDTILSIKEELYTLHPDELPTAENQRLLLKGKALADQKLLKEYNIKEGDTINLMFKAPPKPTITTTTNETPLAVPQPMAPNPFASAAGSLNPDAKPSGGRKHQRIPSVVLSPSPTDDNPHSPGEKPKDLLLDLDDSTTVPLSPVMRDELVLAGTYHDTIRKPEFWQGLLAFLQTQFQTESDVHLAFEDFLRASKSSLTAHEIALIRDRTGVVGMAGT